MTAVVMKTKSFLAYFGDEELTKICSAKTDVSDEKMEINSEPWPGPL